MVKVYMVNYYAGLDLSLIPSAFAYKSEFPNRNCFPTGKYKTINGEMYIEVERITEIRKWFKKIKEINTTYISEDRFIFEDVEYFECSNNGG